MDLQGALNAAYDPVNRRLRTAVVSSASGTPGEDANAFGDAVLGDTLQLLIVGSASPIGAQDMNGALAAIDAGSCLRAVVIGGSANLNTGRLDAQGILRQMISGNAVRVVAA